MFVWSIKKFDFCTDFFKTFVAIDLSIRVKVTLNILQNGTA